MEWTLGLEVGSDGELLRLVGGFLDLSLTTKPLVITRCILWENVKWKKKGREVG